MLGRELRYCGNSNAYKYVTMVQSDNLPRKQSRRVAVSIERNKKFCGIKNVLLLFLTVFTKYSSVQSSNTTV